MHSEELLTLFSSLFGRFNKKFCNGSDMQLTWHEEEGVCWETSQEELEDNIEMNVT